MRYIVMFLVIIGLNANENLEIYKQQVHTLMNYTLKAPTNIYDMFIIQKPIQKRAKVRKKKIIKKIRPKIFNIKPKNSIELLAILNNKVLLKINKIPKWAKVGDKIADYKIIKILNNNSVIVLDNNKMRILSLNNRNKIKIKVR